MDIEKIFNPQFAAHLEIESLDANRRFRQPKAPIPMAEPEKSDMMPIRPPILLMSEPGESEV